MSKSNMDKMIQDGLDRLRAEMAIIDARLDEKQAVAWQLEKILAELENGIGMLRRVKGDIQARADHAIKMNAQGMARRDGRPPRQDGLSPSPSPDCSGLLD